MGPGQASQELLVCVPLIVAADVAAVGVVCAVKVPFKAPVVVPVLVPVLVPVKAPAIVPVQAPLPSQLVCVFAPSTSGLRHATVIFSNRYVFVASVTRGV